MQNPKIIHYCWFGRGPIPEKEKKCIASWKVHFPEYELKLWNEDNVDLETCQFAKQAYADKKYAFVSDYVRTKVLYEYGGLYLDTDVEILKNFENYFDCECLLGFEGHIKVGTAVIYAKPNNFLVGELLRYYESHEYVDKKGNTDTIANTVLLTDLLLKQGLKQNGSEQWIGSIRVIPRDIFYPKKNGEKFMLTERTMAVHKFSGTWLSERERKRGANWLWINVARPFLRSCRSLGIKIIGKERIRKLEIRLRNKLK